MKKNIAIILAGGIGSRVGADRPKQFIEVFGKPILAYTIELYEKNNAIDSTEIVCHKQWIDYTNDIISKYNLSKVKWVVEGGETFQDSVINGLDALEKDVYVDKHDNILIHYGASPFTSQKIINDCICVTEKNGSAFSAIPCYQLLGSNDEGRKSVSWIDRDKVVQVSCPQGFRFDYLLSIYKRAGDLDLIKRVEPHTTSLVYALGDILYQSYGDQSNIKITTVEDIDLFKGYVLLNSIDFVRR